jgi:methionyl aminopeptidase
MIVYKNSHEYELMKKSGTILSKTMGFISTLIKPGISLDTVDQQAQIFLRDHDAQPSFLGLYGFPYALCASVNNEVIHGFPTKSKQLYEGDIVSIDIGCNFKGYHTDMAFTFPVGEISKNRKKLLQVTHQSLINGIAQAKKGSCIGDIAHAVQQTAEENGYSVVRDYTGHGIGMNVHEDPQIPNFGEKGRGSSLHAGMALAIEPMVNEGSYQVRVLSDKWTVVTADGSDSAHFEHTVFIHESGPEVLTEYKLGGLA